MKVIFCAGSKGENFKMCGNRWPRLESVKRSGVIILSQNGPVAEMEMLQRNQNAPTMQEVTKISSMHVKIERRKVKSKKCHKDLISKTVASELAVKNSRHGKLFNNKANDKKRTGKKRENRLSWHVSDESVQNPNSKILPHRLIEIWPREYRFAGQTTQLEARPSGCHQLPGGWTCGTIFLHLFQTTWVFRCLLIFKIRSAFRMHTVPGIPVCSKICLNLCTKN